MSACYKSEQCEAKVVCHPGGNNLFVRRDGLEMRFPVGKEIADVVEQMMEVAYLDGKEQVRSEIRSKLGLD